MELQRLGGAGDVEVVLDLLLAAPTYGRRTLGRPTTTADAVALLSDRPPGCGEDAKSVFLIGVDGIPVGLVDVIRGWPEAGTAHIGLLLIREDRQRAGLGRAAVRALVEVVRGWPEVGMLRASVVQANREVLAFWETVGFAGSGDRVAAVVGGTPHEARVLLRAVGHGSAG